MYPRLEGPDREPSLEVKTQSATITQVALHFEHLKRMPRTSNSCRRGKVGLTTRGWHWTPFLLVWISFVVAVSTMESADSGDRVSGAALRRARRAAAATNESAAANTGPAAPMLALPGPLFPSLDFSPGGSGRRLVVAGHAILVDSSAHPPDSDAHEVLTATSVWSCAVVVAKSVDPSLTL